jgi:hypothetical protein
MNTQDEIDLLKLIGYTYVSEKDDKNFFVNNNFSTANKTYYIRDSLYDNNHEEYFDSDFVDNVFNNTVLSQHLNFNMWSDLMEYLVILCTTQNMKLEYFFKNIYANSLSAVIKKLLHFKNDRMRLVKQYK